MNHRFSLNAWLAGEESNAAKLAEVCVGVALLVVVIMFGPKS